MQMYSSIGQDMTLNCCVADAIYLETGMVAIQKNHDADPLSISGFIQWIGEFANDLIEGTAEDRQRIANAVREHVRQNPPPKDEWENALYVAAILAYLFGLISDFQQRTLAVTSALTQERLTSLSQRVIDQWGVNGVGSIRRLNSRETRFIDSLVENENRFVSQAFGPYVLNAAEDILNNFDGDLIEELGMMIESTASYFPVYASNSMTMARSAASVSQFHSAGYQYAEYVNPMDERTTDFCWMIAGTQFKVSSAMNQAQNLSQASSMSEFKSFAPFVTKQENKFYLNDTELTAENVESVLENAGALMPPFHPRCRTLIVPV